MNDGAMSGRVFGRLYWWWRQRHPERAVAMERVEGREPDRIDRSWAEWLRRHRAGREVTKR